MLLDVKASSCESLLTYSCHNEIIQPCTLCRLLPFDLGIEQVSCEIDDDSGITCEQFLRAAEDTNECVADVRFNYTFANIGLSCVDIVAIKAELGPLGKVNVAFEDVYSYSERIMCSGEFWTIPDKRESVDLCKDGVDTWDITIDVDEVLGRTENMTIVYDWSFSPTMAPTDGGQPVIAPSDYPSQAPSLDICRECTLTGIVSGGMYSTELLFKLGETLHLLKVSCYPC